MKKWVVRTSRGVPPLPTTRLVTLRGGTLCALSCGAMSDCIPRMFPPPNEFPHDTAPRATGCYDHPELNWRLGDCLRRTTTNCGERRERRMFLLEEAARLQPNIIVADNMPRMNGIDACRELTRMLRRTRIIVLSAEDDAAIKQFVLAAGSFAFIEKRAIGTDLLPAVRAACGGHHQKTSRPATPNARAG